MRIYPEKLSLSLSLLHHPSLPPMNFFKSVFSEDSDPEQDSPSPPQNPNPNNPWSFDTILQTLATKSESYKRDLDDFTSGLKAETSAIRAAASRAARDLPASLDATAAAAQGSLETVGEAIDLLGCAIISLGTTKRDEGSNNHDDNSDNNRSLSRPYSRIELFIRSIQCDMNTYCKEVEASSEYENWKLGFDLGEKTEEIEVLLKENGSIGEIYDEIVPKLVDQGTFWTRYFFKVYEIKKAEEARANLVKRAITGEEDEDLSWDVDDEDSNDDLKREVDEREKMEKLESGKNSDFSVVSSQPSMVEEEEIGWDEIVDSERVDEVKREKSVSPNVDELRKRLSAMGKGEEEEEEELGWDIEDDDDETLKS